MAATRNGLIDGWRGLSVLLVIAGHSVAFRYATEAPLLPIHDLIHDRQWADLARNVGFRIISPAGEIGVQFFFVISGYLITGLLAIEEDRNGQISLAAFYIRRIFRIMPAFYFYFLAIWILRNYGLVQLNGEAFVRSGLYVCNLSGFRCSWWLAHTWSLSVEEQFYIVWPIGFIFLGRRRLFGIAVILSALLIGSFFVRDLVSFACIACGSAVALSIDVQRMILRYANGWFVILASVAIIFYPLVPAGPSVKGVFNLVTPLCTTFVFYASIISIGPIAPMLGWRIIQKIGFVSYSLYLWQQVGTAPLVWNGNQTGAGNLYAAFPVASLLFFIPAIISFIALEKPLQRLGQAISRRITRLREISVSKPAARSYRHENSAIGI